MGVNTKNLLISNPDCAENLLSMVDTLTKSGAGDVIVVDSVASLVPKCELDQLGVATNQELHSQIMTQALRKINYSLSCSQTLLVFVNQVRFSPKAFVGRGPMEEVTFGGNALRFYAAVPDHRSSKPNCRLNVIKKLVNHIHKASVLPSIDRHQPLYR